MSESTRYVDIVFDGPPSHESGRFVEAESPEHVGTNIGEWIDRGDGYWALRIPLGDADHERVVRERDAENAQLRAELADERAKSEALVQFIRDTEPCCEKSRQILVAAIRERRKPR